MDISAHVDQLRHEGTLLADAAATAGPDAAIPTCPEWTMRDLVRHQGGVHRWATGYVRDAQTEYQDVDILDVIGGEWPDDAKLVDWFRDGHATLVDTLSSADPAVECWAFLPAPSPLAFWARRQAHETAIHRADAESGTGTGAITPFPTTFAADGIDELLTCFIVRPRGKLRSDEPRTLAVVADDANAGWLVHISDGPVVVDRSVGSGAAADCTVRGAASDVYLWLWNRAGTEPLTVEGDEGIVAMWRDLVQVRWS